MPCRRAPRRASWGWQGRHALRLAAGSRDRGPVVLGARGEPRARRRWGSSLHRGARPRSRRRAAPCGPRPRRAGPERRPGSGHSYADRRAAGYYWFSRQNGSRARARFVLRKLVPPAAFMRFKHPYARRGRAQLFAVYLYRPFWLARWAIPGILEWRRIRSTTRTGEHPSE